MTETPNIFNYATSELSQDAFICYMLNFSEPAKLFLEKCGIQNEEIKLIETQYPADIIEDNKKYKGHIDILATTDNYCLIIEDKTDSDEHDEQIVRYVKAIKKDSKFQNKKISVAFVKRDYLSEQEKNDINAQLEKGKITDVSVSFLTLKDLLECIRGTKDLVLNQWYEKFKDDAVWEENSKRELDKDLTYGNVNEKNLRIYLDKLTTRIKEETSYKKAHWFIAGVGRTPHIELDWTERKEIFQKYWTSLSVYLMFRGTEGIKFVFKQHIYDKKGNRIKIKEYLSEIKQKINEFRNSIEESNLKGWEKINVHNKQRLMIVQKSVKEEKKLIEEIKNEQKNIEKIFDFFLKTTS